MSQLNQFPQWLLLEEREGSYPPVSLGSFVDHWLTDLLQTSDHPHVYPLSRERRRGSACPLPIEKVY